MIDPLVLVVGIPLLWHLGIAGAIYYDAGRVGLSRTKWTAVALAVPLFGPFAYAFERSELSYDPAEDPYARGETKAGFAIHESRQGESLLGPADEDGGDSQGGETAAHDEEDVVYRSPAAREADEGEE